MTLSFTGRKRIRKNFGRIQTLTTMPNLIEVQKTSYDHFLQQDTPAESRGAWGLQDVFDSVFPILDFSERTELSFVKYEFDKPKYDVEECQQRGMTYAAPLRVTLRLTVLDVDEVHLLADALRPPRYTSMHKSLQLPHRFHFYR